MGKSLTHDPLSPAAATRNTGRQRIALRSTPMGAELAVFDSARNLPAAPAILVLKLDHLGDFLIGLPALQELRRCFADARITLICGSWNVETALKLGVADDVRAFDYFPENAQEWDGQVAPDVVSRFRGICDEAFDIAIDLRVDEDTRPLLRHVDAGLRCGIGSRQEHPYLDIVLPREFERRETHLPGNDELVIGVDGFHSRMTTQTPFYHETNFSLTNTHLIYGPYCQLPLGTLRAELAYQMTAPVFWSPRVRLTVDVIRHDQPEPAVAVLRVPRLPKSEIFRVSVVFSNDSADARYEIRTFVGGKPWWTRLRFFGMRLETVEPQAARFRPAELHVGESLSLLTQLVAERVRRLYASELVDRIATGGGAPSSPHNASPDAKCIIIAPLSNSRLRNWPTDQYIRLITLLLAKMECRIVLVGSPEQASQLRDLQHQIDDDRRVINLAGHLDWQELVGAIRPADLVIANNSGVAHLAAACGTPTLAIYSGSHQPQEWGPRGEFVRVLMAAVPCSPCGHDKLEECPYSHRCMMQIDPETVLSHALELLRRGTRSVAEPTLVTHTSG